MNLEFEFLQQTHFQINKCILNSKSLILIDNKNEYDDMIDQLLNLKLIVDSLIKNHNLYTKVKFEKEFYKLWDKYIGKDNFIPLHKNIKSKYISFLKPIYVLLIDEKRIEKSQRKLFLSLFFPIKINQQIRWNDSIYDLRRFFDLLIDKELIEKPKYFNQYISDNFIILNKTKEYQEFTENSFKTSHEKTGYNNPTTYSFWESKIENISDQLR